MGTEGKAGCSPVALSAAILLGLVGILIDVALFGEVAREMLFSFGSAVS